VGEDGDVSECLGRGTIESSKCAVHIQNPHGGVKARLKASPATRVAHHDPLMSQCLDCQFVWGWRRIERRIFMNKMLLALLLAASFLPASHAADKPSETPPPKIKVGDMAPDFTLQDQNGNKVSLHDFKGKKNVALAFYIFAFTGG
jgi:hypothetical protein